MDRRFAFLIALALVAPAIVAAQPPAAPATDVDAVEVRAASGRIALTASEFAALRAADRGAPHYSLEQIASFICEYDVSQTTRAASRGFPPTVYIPIPVGPETSINGSKANAEAAYGATEAFEQTKVRLRAGEATLNDLVAAELRRQEAVLRMYDRDFSGRDEIARTEKDGLVISAPDFRVALDQGQQVLVASVIIRNQGPRAAIIPPVTIKALDRADRVLADTTYTAEPPKRVAPGASLTVEIPFQNMPYYTYAMRAHFGPGSFPRNSRACSAARPFHPPEGLNLSLARNDEAQRTLDAMLSGAYSPGVLIQVDGARWVGEGEERVLEIAAVVRNPTRTALAFPGFSVVLKDADGDELSRQQRPPDGDQLAAGASQRLTLRLRGLTGLDDGPGSLSERVQIQVD